MQIRKENLQHLCNERFYSFESMYRSIERAIEFFNTERPHLSLNMLTPAEASCCTGEYNLLWTSFRRRAIKRNHAVGSGGLFRNK